MASQSPLPDLEKSSANTDSIAASPPPPVPAHQANSRFARFNARIESLAGLEARGIARVLPDERQPGSPAGYVQMALLWFSANLTANHLAVGLLGPLEFKLGFVDAALCAVFGALVGSLGTAYMSIWGAQSGNRTMV